MIAFGTSQFTDEFTLMSTTFHPAFTYQNALWFICLIGSIICKSHRLNSRTTIVCYFIADRARGLPDARGVVWLPPFLTTACKPIRKHHAACRASFRFTPTAAIGDRAVLRGENLHHIKAAHPIYDTLGKHEAHPHARAPESARAIAHPALRAYECNSCLHTVSCIGYAALIGCRFSPRSTTTSTKARRGSQQREMVQTLKSKCPHEPLRTGSRTQKSPGLPRNLRQLCEETQGGSHRSRHLRLGDECLMASTIIQSSEYCALSRANQLTCSFALRHQDEEGNVSLLGCEQEINVSPLKQQ